MALIVGRRAVPQLWLTYQELGDELGCAPSAARDTAIARAWTRKHSRDGQTRVLLPAALMQTYFTTKALGPMPVDRAPPAVVQLHDMLARAASGMRRRG